jgi:CRP-like cAMP-binding protein
MLVKTEMRELLQRNPLFIAFDDERFEQVAAAAQLIRLDSQQVLFQRGDQARSFFVVIEGQVKLFLQSRGGDEKILALVNAGQAFAEAVMFMQGPIYPVSAGATEPTALISIPNADFLAALKGDTGTCLRLLGVLSQRLHAQIQEIEELTLESAGNRLIRHLARRAVRDPDGTLRVHFDETRQMLASQLSIKPETLSRLTRALTDAGLIESDGRDIVIRDMDQLVKHEM